MSGRLRAATSTPHSASARASRRRCTIALAASFARGEPCPPPPPATCRTPLPPARQLLATREPGLTSARRAGTARTAAGRTPCSSLRSCRSSVACCLLRCKTRWPPSRREPAAPSPRPILSSTSLTTRRLTRRLPRLRQRLRCPACLAAGGGEGAEARGRAAPQAGARGAERQGRGRWWRGPGRLRRRADRRQRRRDAVEEAASGQPG